MKRFTQAALGVVSLALGAYKLYPWLLTKVSNDHFSTSDLAILSDPQTLREAAKGTGIFIGAAMNYRDLQNDTEYGKLGAQEYSLLTLENACKMTAIAKSYTDLDFTGCDYIVHYAKRNGMAMRSHNLIWGSPPNAQHLHNPKFIVDEKNATKLEEFMNEYIQKVMSHVGHYPLAWDVVNEALADGPKILKDSPWAQVDDFVCKAFTAARNTNHLAQLFYNDYKHASMVGRYKEKSDKVFNFVKDLKERGCPIDGVGFQSHIDIAYDSENYESIRKNIQRYNEIGLKVHFTEVDVRCNQWGNHHCNYTTPWPKEALERQSSVYQNLLQICLEEPNCLSFESWGYTDKHSSQHEPQNPLPFDKDMQKKPAYFAMLETLKNFNRTHPSARSKLMSGNGEPEDSQIINFLTLR